MPPTTPLSQVITLWVHKAFASLRKTIRSNLALFLSTLLAAPLDPTLSDLARRTPLPTLAQNRPHPPWRFPHPPPPQTPWALTEALLPLLARRFPKDRPLPLIVDWTFAEDGRHQALVAALPLKGRALVVAFALHPLPPFPSQNRVEEEFLHRLGRAVQDLGYTPLFLLDRGFDRVSLMRKLQGWGMGFLIRLRQNREVEPRGGKRLPLKEGYRRVVHPLREEVRLFGHGGEEVEVTLLVYPGGREPWYLAYSGPFGGKPPYGWRMWIEEGFRDLKGQGFGLDRHRLRTGASLRGWLWLLALGMALLILLGARLQGREWLPRLLAHPERQSLFRLGRIALAQGPPPWREAVVEELIRLLQELGGGK